MESIAASWCRMDAQEYARVVKLYTAQFPNAVAGSRHPAVWKLRSCKGTNTGPDADFGPGEWLSTSALQAYFGARGFTCMCTDKPAAKRQLEEQGALLLGFANATPGVQSCTFPVIPAEDWADAEDRAHKACAQEEVAGGAQETDAQETDAQETDVIDLTEDDAADAVDETKERPMVALGGSHWVLLLLRKHGDVIVGCELDPVQHASSTACATSVAVLRSWGATRIRAGWEAAMRMVTGTPEGGADGVPPAPGMLQVAGDKTQCGPWVALLAHMASLVSTGELPVAEAVDAVAGLHGNACMYRAIMYAACCGGGKRKRS